MKSVTPGARISPVEVGNISRHGFWVRLNDEELFLPFAEFPWFKEAAVGKILRWRHGSSLALDAQMSLGACPMDKLSPHDIFGSDSVNNEVIGN